MATKQQVVVAVRNGHNSKSTLRWVLDHSVSKGDVVVLLHVRPPVRKIPTPLGDQRPIEEINDLIVAAYMQNVEANTHRMFTRYRRMCDLHGVATEFQVAEHDSVGEALVEQISRLQIRILVMGAPPRCFLFRKLLGPRRFEYVAKHAPDFCNLLIISNNGLISVKPSNGSPAPPLVPYPPSFVNERTGTMFGEIEEGGWSGDGDGDGDGDGGLAHRSRVNHPSLPPQFPATPSEEGNLQAAQTKEDVASSHFSPELPPAIRFSPRDVGRLQKAPSAPSIDLPNYWSDFSTGSQHSYQPPRRQEVEEARKRTENLMLRAIRRQNPEMPPPAATLRQVNGLDRSEENRKLVEALNAVRLAKQRIKEETRKRMETVQAIETARKEAEEEKRRRIFAESKSLEHAEARQADAEALKRAQQIYRKYTYAELEAATNGFSAENLLCQGKYETVFKGNLQNVSVAIKVLRDNVFQWERKLHEEVELLARIHHPHVVTLLGCCPENGCLAYEFMANGTLQDRLFGENSHPLPWQTRLRIPAEIAAALLFLHSSRPDPLVHRDLKPANIFLDQNYVSKLGDVGLARLLHLKSASISSLYDKDTTPVGTFPYMDPEYQQTGVVSPNSDLYALGIVILQLLTGKPPFAVFKLVKEALDLGGLGGVLDESAGKWPAQKAKELAEMALQCAQLHRQDRPHLEKTVLPCLEAMKAFAEANAGGREDIVPPMFFCPISQEIMQNPVIAADGYTYEMQEISTWLAHTNTSPTTNLVLQHKELTPNHNLRSAILHWKDTYD